MQRIPGALPPRRLVFDAAARLRHKRRNVLHSVLLLGGMAAILWVSAWSLWGTIVAFWAMAGGLLGFLLTPGVAPTWVMRAYRARPLDRQSFPEGIALLEALAARAGLDHVPRLHLLPSATLTPSPSAAPATPAIGITAGLLRALDAREFAGVLAHELSHVRNTTSGSWRSPTR
jgi:heat shock protein HtpX